MSRKKRILLAVLFLGVLLIFGSSRIVSEASGKAGAEEKSSRMYTSVRIRPGETIWSIASEHYSESRDDLNSYVSNLLSINGLESESIMAGHYLTIYYDQSL